MVLASSDGLVFEQPSTITADQARAYVAGREAGLRTISLWQPWATLVAIGAKQYETRSWGTGYKGPIAIHAAKKWTNDLKRLCFEFPFTRALEAAGMHNPERDMPLGSVVALAVLVKCVWIDREPTFAPARGTPEYAFGDYTPGAGRVAWVLQQVRRVDPPIPVKGAMGLWTWTGADVPVASSV